MRDWRKFLWKKGDVLVSNYSGTKVIFDEWCDDSYTSFNAKHYLDSEDETEIVYHEEFLCATERYSLEDKDAAQIYINAIEERLGGKLNLQSLEIEKQPALKPFDKVLVRDSKSDKWRANLLGYIDKDEYYHCVYANWVYCIPYIGNESLLGTTKDVEG